MAFDVDYALAKGYSYTDIAVTLAKQLSFDLVGARNHGYTDAEIATHLAQTYIGDNSFPIEPNSNSFETVVATGQIVDYSSGAIDGRSAYSQAAEVGLAAALIAGLIFFIIMPKKFKATNSLEMGRLWLGWSGAICITAASNEYSKTGIGSALAIFLVTFLFLGPAAFLIGWLYGKFFKFSVSVKSTTNNSSVSESGISGKNESNNQDNNLFLLALEEYESDNRDKGLWAKCFALSNGDEAVTKSMYLKERVRSIVDSFNNRASNAVKEPAKNKVAEDKSVENITEINPTKELMTIKKTIPDFVGMDGVNKNEDKMRNNPSFSDKYLLQERMFKVIKLGSREIMLLSNGHAAVQAGDEIKVFENENLCSKANLFDKYPNGLIFSLKMDDLIDHDILKDKAAQKLKYKNFKELEDKVVGRIPSAMFDMANFLLEGKLLPANKEKAMVLLESAAINGYDEAKKLWHYLKGDVIKCPACNALNEPYLNNCFKCGMKISLKSLQ